MDINTVFENLLNRYPVLGQCGNDIMAAYDILAACFKNDGCLFTCGNGGSAADADHIVGEILKGFVLKRPLPDADKTFLKSFGEQGTMLADNLQCGLRAMNLMAHTAAYTAAANDLGGDTGPAQQLTALGRRGDVLLGISTSGNAKNIALACMVAKIKGMKIIGMTGIGGGRLAELADVCIKVPEKETYKVQELHLPVYHALCMMVEATFFAC